MFKIQNMHPVHFASLDLNLLRVLEALLKQNSVHGAARALGLSQSATSHALARLREVLGDPLFVRAGPRLAATPRALALREPLTAALDGVRAALEPPVRFNPEVSHAEFALGMVDYMELVLLPQLLGVVAKQGPNVNLWVHQGSTVDALSAADSRMQLLVGRMAPREKLAGVRQRRLFGDRFVCALRQGHPALTQKWTVEAYARLGHVLIAPRGMPGGAVDEVLAKQGLSRRVVVGVPHFLVAPLLVAESDLVVTLPESVATTFARTLPITLIKPPISIPPISIGMYWPERLHKDEAQIWLRERIVELVKTLVNSEKLVKE